MSIKYRHTGCLQKAFTGKVHAVLCRKWPGRVKGRDWYDLVWYVSREISLNLCYLEQRMRQSGVWVEKKALTRESLMHLFAKKIHGLDIESAKRDIINFVDDFSKLELWSKEFFIDISQRSNVSGCWIQTSNQWINRPIHQKTLNKSE